MRILLRNANNPPPPVFKPDWTEILFVAADLIKRKGLQKDWRESRTKAANS